MALRTNVWRLPFNQNSGTFETGTSGAEISLESFRETGKLLNFRNANHSTNNSNFREENRMKREFGPLSIRPQILVHISGSSQLRIEQHFRNFQKREQPCEV